jgi:hypothetical protein
MLHLISVIILFSNLSLSISGRFNLSMLTSEIQSQTSSGVLDEYYKNFENSKNQPLKLDKSYEQLNSKQLLDKYYLELLK